MPYLKRPNNLKQILMASGLINIIKLRHALEAENSRADRSPGEFYQL